MVCHGISCAGGQQKNRQRVVAWECKDKEQRMWSDDLCS